MEIQSTDIRCHKIYQIKSKQNEKKCSFEKTRLAVSVFAIHLFPTFVFPIACDYFPWQSDRKVNTVLQSKASLQRNLCPVNLPSCWTFRYKLINWLLWSESREWTDLILIEFHYTGILADLQIFNYLSIVLVYLSIPHTPSHM